MTAVEVVPGWEGSIGPFPGQYGRPHVYARDVHSGAGNCVCGGHLGHVRHVQAAPGVPLPAPLIAALAAMDEAARRRVTELDGMHGCEASSEREYNRGVLVAVDALRRLVAGEDG